jgi:glucose/arabinose dehydrogenase
MKSIEEINNHSGKGIIGKFFLFAGSLLIFIFIFPACRKNNNNPPAGNVKPNLQIIADNLVSPLTLVEAPDGSKRLFIVDQVGKVWIIKSDSTRLSTPFIDIGAKLVPLQTSYDERGLLGMAFHPNFKTNGKFYLFYTAPPRSGGPQAGTTWNNLTRISEFSVSSSDPNQADISSEKVILEADHPQLNHDGGTVSFGPDGYLYISIGDGGGADDDGVGHVSDWYTVNAGGNGQDIYHNLMGNILRIDINNGNPYSIPADNPFAGTAALPEIYAFGFRNPYRFSFDMGGSHQLLMGDAGQSLYEEINLVIKGGNYGWNVKEGTVCFNTDNDLNTRNSCPATDSAGHPLIDPVIQLANDANPAGGVATVIIGGNVYRGTTLPSMQGQYIFGIFSQDGSANAKIYAATPSASANWTYDAISLKDFPDNLGQYLKGFGQDLSGEVYITTSSQQGLAGTTGKVYKLVGVQ